MRLGSGVVVAALVAAGCVEEGVVLCVDAADREKIDSVEIALTLARDDPDAGRVCGPATFQVSRRSLEFCVAVAPGPDYRSAIYLRAIGRRGPEAVATRELEVPIRDGEQDEYEVVLDTSCFDSGDPCEEAEQCLPMDDGAGACVSVPRPGVFDSEEIRDDVDCDQQ